MLFFKKSSEKGLATPKNLLWFVGLHLSSSARKLECALLGVDALKADATVVLQKSVSFDVPEEITSTYLSIRRELTLDHDKINPTDALVDQRPLEPSGTRALKSSNSPSTLAKAILLGNMLASIQEEALDELLGDGVVARDQIIAVAVNDPGFWMKSFDADKQFSYLPITDAGLLAERTGFNVIDSFYAKDWTPIGRGAPFLLLPYWILLNSGDQDKVIVDLGERARWYFIPSSAKDTNSWRRAFSCEISPCGALLNLFARESSKGETTVDVGGKLSVQGRRSPELLEYWRLFSSDFVPSQSDKYSPLTPLPTEDDLALALARFDGKVSSLDALCTAVHWIADSLDASLNTKGDLIGNSFDFIITGAAKQNGLLFSRVSQLLPPHTPRSLAEYGFLEDSFDAVAVATLGILFASNIAAVRPPLASAPRERTLGRLSPGASDAWRRLLDVMNAGD